MTRIAAVQPALALGEVEAQPRRIEDLIRDAHREHSARRHRRPGGAAPRPTSTPRSCAAPRGRSTASPSSCSRAWRASSTASIGGGFLAVRGDHAYGTYVLAEPDGAAHLHDKDIPTAWEHNYYRGGDDDGVVRCERARRHGRPDVRLGVGAQPHVRPRARGRRAARARRHVLALVAARTGPARCAVGRARARPGVEQARELPGQVARLIGAPVAHASHVGPITGETPLGPGIPWRTAMIGETQICDRDGTILARLTLEDGEGHVAADVESAPPAPLDPIGERFWIPKFTLITHAAWHGMNAHGALNTGCATRARASRGSAGRPATCRTRSARGARRRRRTQQADG